MMIPTQLSNQRFILTKDKVPIEPKWNNLNNYPIDDPILKQHLLNKPTYGVVCGINQLIVVDFDNQTAQDLLLPLLPATFTVKTATKGLTHAYFFTDDLTTIRIVEPLKPKGKTILDIQGTGTMVIGPNSKLSTGKTYEIINDLPIATIYKKDLLEIIKNNLTIPHNLIEMTQKKAVINEMDLFKSPTVIKIKQAYKPMQLLEKLKIPIYKNPTECPFHTSESKQCLHVTDDLWHCFHCGKGGDVLTLHQLVYNLSFKESTDILFNELFIEETVYMDAQANINNNIRARRNPTITATDIDNIAKLLIRQFNFITLEETDKIYYYDESLGVYKPNGEYCIASEIEKYYNALIKNTVLNEIIGKIKRLTHKPLAIFDKHKDLICLKNGVFNLETKMLIPHSPTYYFLNYLPVNYNELANCDKFMKFAKEITYAEDTEVLLEVLGFVLMKDYDIQKAIMLVGGGANGKSVFLYVLKNMIGTDNMAAESLQNLTSDPFSASQLFGKIVNISADINSATISESGPLKDLTSGTDTISAQFKFQNKFRFINTAKLIFSCNTIPQSKDLTNGYMRRWKIIKFPYTFEGADDNKQLKYELTDDEELSGLFNLAVDKYYQLRKNGCFSREESVDDIREEYINLSDPLQVFIDKYLIQDNASTILKHELYDKYNAFCVENNIPKNSVVQITKIFNAKNMRMKTVRWKLEDGGFSTREALFGYCWKENQFDDVIKFD